MATKSFSRVPDENGVIAVNEVTIDDIERSLQKQEKKVPTFHQTAEEYLESCRRFAQETKSVFRKVMRSVPTDD